MRRRSVNEELARLAALLPHQLRLPPTAAMAGLPMSQVNDLGALGGDHSVGIVINELAGVAGSAR